MNDVSDNPTMRGEDSPLELEALIEAYFDRELPAHMELPLQRLVREDSRAARHFSETEAAVEALRMHAPDAPDLTSRILSEVGHRRGWVGARLQRFVAIGRVGIAACLLVALSAMLLANRYAPDAAVFNTAPTPIADVAQCASRDADGTVKTLLATIDRVGVASGLNEVRDAWPAASALSMRATFVSLPSADFYSVASTRQKCPKRSLSPAAESAVLDPAAQFAKEDSFKKLSAQQRVGAAVFVARQTARDTDEKNNPVGGW